MATEPSGQKPTGFISWLSDNYWRLERLGMALAIAAYAVKQFQIDAWPIAIGIGFSVLGTVVFVGSYRIKDLPPDFLGMIFANVSHIGSSICIVGIMFELLKLPGASNMLGIGSATLLIVSPLLIYKWIISSPKYKPFAVRAILVLVLSGAMVLKYL